MANNTESALTPSALRDLARDLYPRSASFRRLIQINRPLICPFGSLIAQVPENSRVLDVGCGSGLFIALLSARKKVSLALGFDASDKAISLAREMRSKHPAKAVISFERCDVNEPWPSGLYDVVTIIDLLHHLDRENQARTFHAASAKVRPGGYLILKDVGKRPVWRAHFSRLHDIVIARQLITIPDELDILAWQKKAGLLLAARETHNMLWYGHEMWAFRKPEPST